MKEVNQADQHVPGNHASSVAEALTRRLQLIKLDCNNLKLEVQAIHHQNTALKLRKNKFHAKLAALASQVALESEVMIDKNSNNAVGIYNEDKEFKLHWESMNTKLDTIASSLIEKYDATTTEGSNDAINADHDAKTHNVTVHDADIGSDDSQQTPSMTSTSQDSCDEWVLTPTATSSTFPAPEHMKPAPEHHDLAEAQSTQASLQRLETQVAKILPEVKTLKPSEEKCQEMKNDIVAVKDAIVDICFISLLCMLLRFFSGCTFWLIVAAIIDLWYCADIMTRLDKHVSRVPPPRFRSPFS